MVDQTVFKKGVGGAYLKWSGTIEKYPNLWPLTFDIYNKIKKPMVSTKVSITPFRSGGETLNCASSDQPETLAISIWLCKKSRKHFLININ